MLVLLLPLFFGISLLDYYGNEDSPPAADLLAFALSLSYSAVLIAVWATTVGKRAFSMYVVRPDGRKVGLGRAYGRELAKFVSAITLGIGFLMIAFREDKRGLHDLIADTVVVNRA